MATAETAGQPAGPDEHGPAPHGIDRRRVLVLGAIVGLVAAVAGIAVVTRAGNSSSKARGTTAVTSPIAARFPSSSAVTRPRPSTTTAAPATTAPTTTTVVLPPPTVPVVVVTSPPATAPDTTPTTELLPAVTDTLPPPLPPYSSEVLTWTAPPVLNIVHGKTARLTVQAHNPTDRTVSMSHPLACTPRLDHGEMCSDTVQLILAGESASATYTIDAHGVAPGHYTVEIEGVLTVNVTVS